MYICSLGIRTIILAIFVAALDTRAFAFRRIRSVLAMSKFCSLLVSDRLRRRLRRVLVSATCIGVAPVVSRSLRDRRRRNGRRGVRGLRGGGRRAPRCVML